LLAVHQVDASNVWPLREQPEQQSRLPGQTMRVGHAQPSLPMALSNKWAIKFEIERPS
jgi:hypothetical protein